ncbi:alpha/beta hydrolase [Methylobacterium sp. WL30]|uniref:alpha/beta hydrolase n=1 Tax=unclassified Methylobacterium TaxID=2615210 RepID=UPI0011C7A8D3|nr:alpha/beta hydrolase [Methylobacterium sp. WL93]TXN50624.1 alpha/beta hydrolase [Methylobacterium sp. WL119]TXN68239.1 alpha/beta hydrolase [Methylobacterium sp. WL30]
MRMWTRFYLLIGIPFLAGLKLEAAPMSSPGVIEAAGPGGPLSGTLLGPSDPNASVVLIVPGSGPTDRDGNNPLGVRASSYRLIAEGLAARGIRSVRIDKRGMFGSAQAVPDANAVTMEDYAADVRLWAATIREKTGAACVWVLGHSEGGLVTMLAAQRPENICGLLLVSAPGRKAGDVLREQLAANPANAPIREQAGSIIAQLERGEKVTADGIHPALRPLFQPEVQGFLISLFALDPTKLIAAYDGPVLILQGLRDIQVSLTDAERLHQARPDTEIVLLPDTNHVLKAVTSNDRAANATTYQDANLPLAPGVIDALATFVNQTRKHR